MINENEETLRVSGEELKSLMAAGQLPQEYISEENLNILLSYEHEQMSKSKFYDTSIITYCTNLLVTNYGDEESRTWWQGAFKNIQKVMLSIDKSHQQARSAILNEIMASRREQDLKDLKEFSAKFVQQLQKEFEISSVSSVAKEKKSRKTFPVLSKHVAAFMFAVILALPIALIAFYTDIFGSDVQNENITITTNIVRVYGSVEEFEAANNISLLLPAWLLDSLEIDVIDYFGGQLIIDYLDSESSLLIELNKSVPNTDGILTHKNNDIIFYISICEYNMIFWSDGSNWYSFNMGVDINEYVLKVIENAQ